MDDPTTVLVRECQELSPSRRSEKYGELYEKSKDDVYNVCYRMLGNSADALDAAQATFEVAFRRIDGFRFEARFSSWLTRVARNCCIDSYRRARRFGSMESLDATADDYSRAMVDSDRHSPESAAELSELSANVRRGIARITPKLRAVVVKRYLQGMSYRELAKALDISIGTVKSRLYRAHEALAHKLESLSSE